MYSEPLIKYVETALSDNEHCAPGLLAPKRVFTTALGPSGGPELLTVVSINDRFGSVNWYGHVFRHPDTGKFIAGLFYSSKLLNGANEEILFKRLHHWTVIDPKTGSAISQIDTDCYSAKNNFGEAVVDLCTMISVFDKKARVRGVDLENYSNTSEDRLLQAYDEWREGDETFEAFPLPPDNPSNSTNMPKRRFGFPRPTLVT